MKKSKIRTIESLKSRYGMLFVTPWLIGMLIFFIIPIGLSLWLSFCKVGVTADGIVTKYIGFKNYDTLLNKHPKYTTFLTESISSIFYLLPAIIIISMILAIVLNGKFKGRIFFRALYFSPIIFATSAVMKILENDPVNIPIYSNNEELSDFLLIFTLMDLPPAVTSVMTFMVSFSLYVMQNAAVPIVLFLAGLQEIPVSLYEVSKIEGADKWEEFWMITIPSLRNIITLVVVYTMIDLFAQSHNTVVSRAQDLMTTQEFGTSSAMLWFYFLIVIAAIGAVYSLYYRFCVKKWE